ncbi:MAG TPA: hypothetical protein VKK30_08645, partial [Actinomycetota bacterium]|nr:hypothetical protein [Actinomycetota bacterium]
MAEAITRAIERVQSVTGDAHTTIRVFLPDGVGRLRQVAVAGRGPTLGRKRSTRRRTVFEDGE